MTITDEQFDTIKQRLAQDPHHTYPYRLLAGAPPAPLALFDPGPSTSNSTSYADLTGGSIILPWDGSTPAFRALCFAKHDAGSDLAMTLALAVAGQDDGAAEGTYGTEFADTAVTTATTYTLIDTGWVVPPAMPTLADTLAVIVRGKSANVVNGKHWKSISLYIDWNYNR